MGSLCDYNLKHLTHKYMLAPALIAWLRPAVGCSRLWRMKGDMKGGDRRVEKKETDRQMCSAGQEVCPDGRVVDCCCCVSA